MAKSKKGKGNAKAVRKARKAKATVKAKRAKRVAKKATKKRELLFRPSVQDAARQSLEDAIDAAAQPVVDPDTVSGLEPTEEQDILNALTAPLEEDEDANEQHSDRENV